MAQKTTVVGSYILTDLLGEGTTGKVRLAKHKDTGKIYAIKIISKSIFSQNPSQQIKVQREIALMRAVQHPNILQFIYVLESQRHLYIVMEYAQNGELFNFLVRKKKLSVELAMDFFRQIVLAIEYLHWHGICHRDLKPENILLDSNNQIKVADFGFARWVKHNITETSCGSPHYAAPEVIKGTPYDGRKADIWSLGVILYALLAGYLPFDDTSTKIVLAKVKRGKFTMPPFPPDVQDLIYKMLTVDPAKRITINEIKQHPCFRRNLPTNYILPSPIPFTSVSNAINMSELSPNIISVLTQIGFSNINELKSDLESTDNTMAKVFVHMLTSNYDLDQLPWDEFSTSHEHSAHFDSNSFIINPTQHEPTPFHPTNANTNSASFDANSFASHPSWDYESTNVTSIILERNIEISGRTIWHVMCGVQEAADDCGLQWFHPNRITMYVRTNDATFYGSVIGEYISENKISVKVRMHKGIETQFVDFAERILQVMGLSVT